MPAAISIIEEIRGLLAEKFPITRRPAGQSMETGLEALDAQGGGLRRGVVTEFSGSLGCGALFLDAMLGAAQRARCFGGLVDCGRAFDPQSYNATALRRLLWVRCGTAEHAVKAADLLLRDGNLPLLLLDLQAIPAAALRRIPATTWHRFHRLVEQTATAFVVLTPQPMVEGAKVRIAARTRWSLADLRRRRRELRGELELQVFARGEPALHPLLRSA